MKYCWINFIDGCQIFFPPESLLCFLLCLWNLYSRRIVFLSCLTKRIISLFKLPSKEERMYEWEKELHYNVFLNICYIDFEDCLIQYFFLQKNWTVCSYVAGAFLCSWIPKLEGFFSLFCLCTFMQATYSNRVYFFFCKVVRELSIDAHICSEITSFCPTSVVTAMHGWDFKWFWISI